VRKRANMRTLEKLLCAMVAYVYVVSFMRLYEQNRLIDFIVVNGLIVLSVGMYAALNVVNNE